MIGTGKIATATASGSTFPSAWPKFLPPRRQPRDERTTLA